MIPRFNRLNSEIKILLILYLNTTFGGYAYFLDYSVGSYP